MRKATVISIFSATLALFLLILNLISISNSPSEIFNKTIYSVVEIKAKTGDNESFGTAVLISSSDLVTNFHVISFISESTTYVHDSIEMRFADSNEYQTVELVKFDSKLDIALLKTDGRKGIAFKINAGNYKIGQNVLLIGNANNLGISLTTGIISRKEVEININGSLNNYIQVDATSTNGVSGGALLDEKGKLIGIITLRLIDSNNNPIYGYVYAIPVISVLKFVNSV